MEPTAMETLMTSLVSIVTSGATVIGSVAGAVIANPILLIPIGIGLLGTGVAIVRKLA